MEHRSQLALIVWTEYPREVRLDWMGGVSRRKGLTIITEPPEQHNCWDRQWKCRIELTTTGDPSNSMLRASRVCYQMQSRRRTRKRERRVYLRQKPSTPEPPLTHMHVFESVSHTAPKTHWLSWKHWSGITWFTWRPTGISVNNIK